MFRWRKQSSAVKVYAIRILTPPPSILRPGPVWLRRVSAGNMLTAIGVMQRHWRDMVQDLITGEMCRIGGGGSYKLILASLSAALHTR
jgi:hypothetical protein